MECELCGKRASKQAIVEETLLNVCEGCLRFGKEFRKEVPRQQKAILPLEELSLNPSFAAIILAKREAMNLSRKQLARMLKERVSVIERVENGMRPTKELAKKLEKMLKVKLLGYEIPEQKVQTTKEPLLTLGDIAQLRLRRHS